MKGKNRKVESADEVKPSSGEKKTELEARKPEKKHEKKVEHGRFQDGFTFMFVHTRGEIKQFFVSKKLLRFLIALGLVIVLVTVAAVATYTKLVVTASRVFMLQEENQRLKKEVATIDSIKSELLALQNFREQVLKMMGADSATIEQLRKMTYEEIVQQYPDLQAPVSVGVGEGDEAAATDTVGQTAVNISRLPAPGKPSKQPVQTDIPAGLPVKTQIYRISLGFTGVHTGIDIATSYNTPVIATADGIVVEAGTDSIYGNHVIIKHRNGYETLYAHMSTIRVKKGDSVRKGQILGFVGMTGHTSGPHVHYEVRQNGIAIDPMPFLKNNRG